MRLFPLAYGTISQANPVQGSPLHNVYSFA
jgi:hypothetical protein